MHYVNYDSDGKYLLLSYKYIKCQAYRSKFILRQPFSDGNFIYVLLYIYLKNTHFKICRSLYNNIKENNETNVTDQT